jgi:hypothetical protein
MQLTHRSAQTLLLSTIAIGCASHIALADDAATATLTVVEADARLVVLPAPVELTLRRRQTAPAPDCAGVQAQLAPFANQLARCFEPAQRSTSACRTLRRLVDQVGQSKGPTVQPSLLQFWPVSESAPIAFDDPEATRAAIAAEHDVLASDVLLAESVDLTGPATAPRVQLAGGGTSWASRLSPWIGADQYDVSYVPEAKAFRTSNQLLACGMLAGDITVEFGAEASASFTTSSTLLAPSDLWELYQLLSVSPELVGPDAVLRGAAFGRALAALDLDEHESFAARVQLLELTLVAPESQSLRRGLTPDDFDDVGAGRSESVSAQLSFRAVVD